MSVIGHADRTKPLRDYCLGLMMPCERKSVEPVAAVTAPERTAAQHQSLLHFVCEGRWSDEKVLAKVREIVLLELLGMGVASRHFCRGHSGLLIHLAPGPRLARLSRRRRWLLLLRIALLRCCFGWIVARRRR